MFKRLLLGLFTTCVVNAAYMMPIQTTVKNNSEHTVNLLCQASGPLVDRFGQEPGWFIDKWSLLNLEPGQEKSLDLWAFRDVGSKLRVSVVSSTEKEVLSGDQVIVNYFTGNGSYLGDATFYRVDNNQLKVSKSGKLECSVTGGGTQFSAQLVVL